MKRSPLFLLSVLSLLPPLPAGELPQLKENPWIGYYVGYERRNYHFMVSSSGECLLSPISTKGSPLSSRLSIKIRPVVEDVLPGGQIVAKAAVDDGWEAVTPASVDPESVVYRGTVTGGARFEVKLEFDGDQISAGGRLLEKGTLANPRFMIRIQVPDVYYHENDAGKKAEKAKKDRIDLVRTDGKKLKLDLMTPLDAESAEFNGPGVQQARVDIEGYRGLRLDLDAGKDAFFEFWNKGEVALVEGFTLGWRPDPVKDPEGKGRVVLKAR
jgi:hypothetical protein